MIVLRSLCPGLRRRDGSRKKDYYLGGGAWSSGPIEVLTFVDGYTSMIGCRLLVPGWWTYWRKDPESSTHQLKNRRTFFPTSNRCLKKRMIPISLCKCNSFEDWSNGKHSPDYVMRFVDSWPAWSNEYYCPITLEYSFHPDILNSFLPWSINSPVTSFRFSGHNDCDLGTATPSKQSKQEHMDWHLTVNGMGERAGNTPLASVIAVLNDFMPEVKPM